MIQYSESLLKPRPLTAGEPTLLRCVCTRHLPSGACGCTAQNLMRRRVDGSTLPRSRSLRTGGCTHPACAPRPGVGARPAPPPGDPRARHGARPRRPGGPGTPDHGRLRHPHAPAAGPAQQGGPGPRPGGHPRPRAAGGEGPRAPRRPHAAAHGGEPVARQVARLREKPHIVVGTPSRVLDHLGHATLTLRSVHMLVLDDAGKMLALGLRSEVEQILVRTPSTRQTVLFSAGLPDEIRAMVSRYLRNPIWVPPLPARSSALSAGQGA